MLSAARSRSPRGTLVLAVFGQGGVTNAVAVSDTQILAWKLPAGILLVPSIKGVSHHWAEDTSDADIVLGCQALADAADEITREGASVRPG